MFYLISRFFKPSASHKLILDYNRKIKTHHRFKEEIGYSGYLYRDNLISYL